MSADNGTYALVTPGKGGVKEYRVTQAQAIDNINYFDRKLQREEYDEELINYFGDCKVLTDRTAALIEADSMEERLKEDFGFGTEYGICFIEYNHEFPVVE